MSGCQSMEDYRNERAEYAIKHFEGAKYRELVEGKKLTLQECIDLARQHNLDLQVSKLEEKVAREMKQRRSGSLFENCDRIQAVG